MATIAMHRETETKGITEIKERRKRNQIKIKFVEPKLKLSRKPKK